jgi:uncharacterized protein (DUF4415 family)
MSESKRTTASSSERPLSPDDIGWDPDDAPELDEEWFARADHHIGDQLVQRGKRPGVTEEVVLPCELTERFRAGGPGWQIRIEDALKEWMAEHPEKL